MDGIPAVGLRIAGDGARVLLPPDGLTTPVRERDKPAAWRSRGPDDTDIVGGGGRRRRVTRLTGAAYRRAAGLINLGEREAGRPRSSAAIAGA